MVESRFHTKKQRRGLEVLVEVGTTCWGPWETFQFSYYGKGGSSPGRRTGDHSEGMGEQ